MADAAIPAENGQALEALEAANRVRKGQARMVREIRRLPRSEGLQRVAGLLESRAELVGRMKVIRLLSAPRYMGPHNVERLMERCGCSVSPRRRVSELEEWQRAHLARALRAKA